MANAGFRTIVALFALLWPLAAQAQNYPDRPVKVIVPYTPGGGTDTVGRAISQKLSEMWKQPVVIENRPGAGSVIGGDAVAKSAPDGYTLLFTDCSTFVINPHIYANMPFDPLKQLAPVSLAVQLAPVLAIANDAPFRTVPELVAYAKANPGKLTYASPGVGSYPHVGMEYFKHLAGIDILHVPYRGSVPAVTDLLAGRVTMYMVTLSVFDAYEKDGKLKIIATGNEKRLPIRPELPTMGESVKDFSVSVWFGYAAPAGTPPAVLDKIHNDVATVLRDPQFNETFIKPQAYIPGSDSREQLAARLKAEYAKWAELVRISGAKVQ